MKKKLTFRAETLRQLSSDELQRANGGTIATPTTILSGETFTITISMFLAGSCVVGACGLIIQARPSAPGIYDGRWTCVADNDVIDDGGPTTNG